MVRHDCQRLEEDYDYFQQLSDNAMSTSSKCLTGSVLMLNSFSHFRVLVQLMSERYVVDEFTQRMVRHDCQRLEEDYDYFHISKDNAMSTSSKCLTGSVLMLNSFSHFRVLVQLPNFHYGTLSSLKYYVEICVVLFE
ncbi:hypothetical protein M514_15292 [Trichuris suis]|uniref:Uncharacterized protein n=1 Tax=Trichuris suis TaxID=68888 RepID=A0A085NSL0_9BILA|nr:hypothetical protein M514_15292 [Trichuris suis]